MLVKTTPERTEQLLVHLQKYICKMQISTKKQPLTWF